MLTNFSTIITIGTSTLIISFFAILFSIKIYRQPISRPLSGFTLLIFLLIHQIESFIENSLGSRYRKLSPVFLYLFFYIIVNSLLASLIGEPFVTPFRTPIIIFFYGIMMIFGTIWFGFRFKGWRYLLNYLNPIEIMSMISSFISISFRLFGNLFAGYLIMGLFYQQINSDSFPEALRSFNILALLSVPLALYFDFFSVFLHTTIFILLTLTYWSLSRPAEDYEKNPPKLEISL